MNPIKMSEEELSVIRTSLEFAVYDDTKFNDLRIEYRNGCTTVSEVQIVDVMMALRKYFKAKMNNVRSPLTIPFELPGILEVVNTYNKLYREFYPFNAILVHDLSVTKS